MHRKPEQELITNTVPRLITKHLPLLQPELATATRLRRPLPPQIDEQKLVSDKVVIISHQLQLIMPVQLKTAKSRLPWPILTNPK